MEQSLDKIKQLSALYSRIMEIDDAIKRLDGTAIQALEGEAEISLNMVVTKAANETVHKEFSIPPVFIPGYPVITSIMLPEHTNTSVERVLLPERITLSLIGTVVAHYNVERKKIMQEINRILYRNVRRSKDKAEIVPITGLQ